MDKYKILLTASFKKQKGSLIGILLLLLILSLCLFSSVNLYVSGQGSVSGEMDRLGFGNFTVWVNGNESELKSTVEALSQVREVRVQPLIFAGYEIGGKYSDNEGQLLVYDGTVPYRFIDEYGVPLQTPDIKKGTVYISPALRSSYDVGIGDTVIFELSRYQGTTPLTVAGYFEDAFMGSSMIDMKSFLICEEDRNEMLSVISSAEDFDVLGKYGAMLHVFKSEDCGLNDNDFQKAVFGGTELPLYTEFSYSHASILSYMLMLQNILSGFLIAFSAVLLMICLIVLGHSLSSVIEQNKRDMAILKTIGLSGGGIRGIYFVLYGTAVLMGLLPGLALSFLLSGKLAAGMVSSTGMRIPISPPYLLIAAILLFLLLLFSAFLFLRTRKILTISPMQTIRETASHNTVRSPLSKKALPLTVALRQLLSGKRNYIGVCLISVLLVVFLSVIGKMGAWLGTNGEGLMNAFSVADHDLGVQPFNETVPMDEIERVINWYSPITDKYELAMQSVTLDGQEYTANVLSDTKWFHLLSGTVCDGDGILITDTVAGEQGLSVGDTVTVAANGRAESYTVSGIYQCANGIGSNIGMSLAGYSKIGNINGYIWCTHYILENGGVRDYAMRYLQENYRGIDVHTNSWSGLDGIVSLMHLLIAVIYLIAALFIFITVGLTASKLLSSETGDMAIYKSLGFTSETLRFSFTLRFFITVSLGAVLGAILSSLTADTVIGTIFRSFGIGSFSSGFGFMGSVLPPLAVTLLFCSFAWLMSGKIKRISLVRLISENDE